MGMRRWGKSRWWVDPDFQGRGIGAGLIAFATDWMRDAGMVIAMVETGADPVYRPSPDRWINWRQRR